MRLLLLFCAAIFYSQPAFATSEIFSQTTTPVDQRTQALKEAKELAKNIKEGKGVKYVTNSHCRQVGRFAIDNIKIHSQLEPKGLDYKEVFYGEIFFKFSCRSSKGRHNHPKLKAEK